MNNIKCLGCKKNDAILTSYGYVKCPACQNEDRKKTANLTKGATYATAAQADRIQTGQLKHAGDILQPWDSHGKPNKDFVDHYPDKATDYFTKEELEKL